MKSILIVDDEVEMRIAMSETLARCGYEVKTAYNAADALKQCKVALPDLVVTDMTMPRKSGLELLKELKAISPTLPVLMVTGYGTIDTAVEAMKAGAFDYVLKPFKLDLFTFLVERALHHGNRHQPPSLSEAKTKAIADNKYAQTDLPFQDSEKNIITQDSAMQEMLETARSVAKSSSTVLVESESGTGKELLARFIHRHSNRAQGPFVAVNCAALPDNLLESELFGHKKGAFTGALQDHKGKFEQAHTGTLLLDEIGEMDPLLQAKLLRVLQEREVDRVGGSQAIPVDVRVIATTNKNLMQLVEANQFREDLFYRLNVVPLQLPPLRERKGDIPLLAAHFIRIHAHQNDLPSVEVADEGMDVLQQYNWRGNIRELENVIERAVLFSAGQPITPKHLMLRTLQAARPA